MSPIPTLTKRKISERLAYEKPWLNRIQAELIVELLFETIAMGVIRDGFCDIRGFGKFFMRQKRVPPKLTSGVFPLGITCAEAIRSGVTIPPTAVTKGQPRQLRRAIYFRPHKTLANLINS